jgi:GT2 family glycosyltransferase
MVSSETLPFVRVVLLDFNGGSTIVDAVDAVTKTQWPADRLEIVCVDNGSTDGSLEEIERRFPSVVTMRNGQNLGFPGNNVAMAVLDGVDYVALVNSDALVEPTWLAPLVERASSDNGIGAVCPKILFADRFVEVSVGIKGEGDTRAPLSMLRAVSSNGEDVFTRSHVANGGGRTSDRAGIFEWLSDGSVLRVPVDAVARSAASAEITLEIEARASCVVTLNESEGIERTLVAGERASIVLTVTQEPVDVVNNVGSWLDESWIGHERGLYDVDRGHLNDVQETGTWCGAAVLLRASHLLDVGLFEESFFLYYEDTDLAVRGRGRGWRFVVEPASVVRHIHSASTVEGSAIAAHFIERNRLLLVTRHGSASEVFREFARYPLVTASYARAACKEALKRRQTPDFKNVVRRLHSYVSALRLVPSSISQRRRISADRYLSRSELRLQIARGSATVSPESDEDAGLRSNP